MFVSTSEWLCFAFENSEQVSWAEHICVGMCVCVFMFSAHAATRVYEYVFMFAHENVCFKNCQCISSGHCRPP